jgi:hypothetical protein
MPLSSRDGLVCSLDELGLLNPSQRADFQRDLLPRFAEPKALAGEILRRGWLTSYQVNVLLQGRAAELVLGAYLIQERLGNVRTVATRLARGRQLLRDRLARREVLFSTAALAVVLARDIWPSPAFLVAAQAISQFRGSGLGTVAVKAQALSQGMMKTLFVAKVSKLAAVAAGLILGVMASFYLASRVTLLQASSALRSFDPCFHGSRSRAAAPAMTMTSAFMFRSLFSWITLSGWAEAARAAVEPWVSILVFMDHALGHG